MLNVMFSLKTKIKGKNTKCMSIHNHNFIVFSRDYYYDHYYYDYCYPRGFFNPLPDHAGHRRDPHLPAGSVPGPVCQPGARICVEMYPSSAR